MLRWISGAACAVLLAMAPQAAQAESGSRFQDGAWRAELTTSFGVHSGSQDRDGDLMFVGTLEYEIPTTPRTTLGLRLMPLLVYVQDNDNPWRLRNWRERPSGDGSTVFGGGGGLSFRVYPKPEAYQGLFFEVSSVVFGHKERFNGNNSNVNFLSAGGVGYKFRNNIHAVLKYEHISNAGLGKQNRGVNTLGIGLGYTF